MINDISKLLIENDCVILPGFGGIVSHYESAKKDLSNGLIFPPTKSLAFNTALQKNDGLLQNHVAQLNNISFSEAENEVQSFVNSIKSSLKSNNTYIMKGIGRFVLGEDSQVEFFPQNEANFNLSSYGLPQLPLIPVSRLKKTTPVVVGVLSPTATKKVDKVLVKSTNYSSGYFRIAATLGALFILTTLIYHTFIFDKTNANIQEASFISNKTKSDQAAILEEALVEETNIQEEKVEVAPQIPTELIEPISTDIAQTPKVKNQHTVRIIVGSFGESRNAINFSNDLNRKGLTSEVISGPNGFSRVCILEQVDNKQAMVSLERIRNTVNANAWILD